MAFRLGHFGTAIAEPRHATNTCRARPPSPMTLPKAWPGEVRPPRLRDWPPRLMHPGPSPLVVWAMFLVWGYAEERRKDIPGYVLHILSFYVWLKLTGDCPCEFLADLQEVLCRTVQRRTRLPSWLHDMVYQHRVV